MKLACLLSAALVGSSAAFAPVNVPTHQRSSALAPMQMAAEGELYIDQNRRNLMNLILVGSAAVTIGGLAVPYVLFFLPPGSGGDGGGVSAKNANGDDLKETEYLASHTKGDHSLAQGLKGDATYLIIKDDGTLEDYGLNAVCTHLGCVVPWSAANNKFMCPCHGSQVSKYFVCLMWKLNYFGDLRCTHPPMDKYLADNMNCKQKNDSLTLLSMFPSLSFSTS